MPEITDVKKLRPELLDLSVAELERRRTEIDMAIIEKSKIEEEKRKAELVEEAGKHMDNVVAGLKWLEANGFLSKKVKESYTTGKGVFMPHLSFKHPKG